MRGKKYSKAVCLIIVVATAAYCPSLPALDLSKPFPLSALPAFSDSKIGDRGNEIATSLANIQINHDVGGQLQNEEMVCINPTNLNNAVAIWRDFRLGYRRVGIGYTFDGGQTWHDTLLVVMPYPWQSDPVLWVDRNGVFYAGTLSLYTGGTSQPSAIGFQRSTDGGVSWSAPVYAVADQPNVFEDKEWLAMDQTGGVGDGNIYIVWSRFFDNLTRTQIMAVRTTDGGQTFSAPLGVSNNGNDYVQWPVAAVGAGGVVYIAWYQQSASPRIAFGYSSDYGQTYVPQTTAFNLNSTLRELNGGILSFPYPAMVCDTDSTSPYYGNIYIIYADGQNDWDIWMRRSTDGGMSWSSPVRINDDTFGNQRDQFHPWVAIDRGILHVCFFDRRDDPQNLLYNLYYTRSTDGGRTWEINHRISTVSSDPSDARLAGLLGEYIGISAFQGDVQMAWTDTRNFNQDVFSARIRALFVPGDTNNNGETRGTDVTYLVAYFKGLVGPPDPPLLRADANGDCTVNAADITYLVRYFKGLGPAPIIGDCRR